MSDQNEIKNEGSTMSEIEKRAMYDMVKTALYWWVRFWYKNSRLYDPTWEDIENEEDHCISFKEQAEVKAWDFMYLFQTLTFEEFELVLKRFGNHESEEQS